MPTSGRRIAARWHVATILGTDGKPIADQLKMSRVDVGTLQGYNRGITAFN